MVLDSCDGYCNINCNNRHYNKEIIEMKTHQFFKGFKKGMKNFGYNLALIVNTLLLTFVYVVGVGITSITAKIFRKHFLEMKLSKNGTYWSDLNLRKKKMEEYYRQC